MVLLGKLKTFYYLRIRKISTSDYNIMKMRDAGIAVGQKCRMFSRISSMEPWLISIGDNVTVSSGVSFITHDNAIIKVIDGKTDVVGAITVGNDCFIGMNSTVMYGVTLGDNCIVGAGAVVTRSFPAHTVIAGNPARAICSTEEYAAKYQKYAIDFRGMLPQERRKLFEEHPEKLIKR